MIALGCDHGGFELKQEIIQYLEEKEIPYKDFGCDSTKSVDYPIYARKVGRAIQNGGMRERNPDLRNRNRYFYSS